MRFIKHTIPAAALSVAFAADAAPNTNRVALMTGSEIIQPGIVDALGRMCTANGGVATNFVANSIEIAASTFPNTTVVCANSAVVGGAGNTYHSKPNFEFINFKDLPFAEIRFNAYGSFASLLILNGVKFDFFEPSVLRMIEAPLGAVALGGFSDIEPNRFAPQTIGSNAVFWSGRVGLAQTFGVAASSALYAKLFDAQKAAGLIPAACTVDDTGQSYCIPNIAKAQMATIMANDEFNAAYRKGLGFLTGVPDDEGVELRYLRGDTDTVAGLRIPHQTSGAQAAAQIYFLGTSCSRNALSVVDQPTSSDPAGFSFLPNALIGAIRVVSIGNTDRVRRELNKRDIDPGVPVVANYALAVLSGGNSQSWPDVQDWRWLRVDGAPIGENAVPGSPGNTNYRTMHDGSYSFYFDLTFTAANVSNYIALSYVAEELAKTPPNLVTGLANPSYYLFSPSYTKYGQTCLGSSTN
jgi:hypothetical protein